MSIAIAPPRGNAAGSDRFQRADRTSRPARSSSAHPNSSWWAPSRARCSCSSSATSSAGRSRCAGVNYVDFVVPGFITTGVLFNAMYASAGMAEDMSAGLIARLRSLADSAQCRAHRSGVADTAIQVWGLAITVAIGFLVGFRVHGSWSAALAAAALVILFGFVFEWVFVLIGMVAGSAQAAQGFALIVFPFTLRVIRLHPGRDHAVLDARIRRESADHGDGQRGADAHAGPLR